MLTRFFVRLGARPSYMQPEPSGTPLMGRVVFHFCSSVCLLFVLLCVCVFFSRYLFDCWFMRSWGRSFQQLPLPCSLKGKASARHLWWAVLGRVIAFCVALGSSFGVLYRCLAIETSNQHRITCNQSPEELLSCVGFVFVVLVCFCVFVFVLLIHYSFMFSRTSFDS